MEKVSKPTIYEDENAIFALFPCQGNFDRSCHVPILYKHGPQGQSTWEWDGNREAPTLSPSIQCMTDTCKWHGYIRNGEMVSC